MCRGIVRQPMISGSLVKLRYKNGQKYMVDFRQLWDKIVLNLERSETESAAILLRNI